MIEAGEVGAVFTVVDKASGVLDRLALKFKDLDGLIGKVRESLKGLGAAGIGTLEAKLGGVTKELTAIGDKSSIVTTDMTAGFGRVDTALTVTSSRVATLAKELGDLRVQTKALGSVTPGTLPMLHLRGSGGGNGGGGHGGGGSGNFHMHGLSVPGGRITPGHNASLMTAAGAGFLGYEAFKYAADLADAQEKLKIAGVSAAEIAQATSLERDVVMLNCILS